MVSREEQKEKRKGEILLAGLDLFIRKGYNATKIKDIAEHVGMSVGLLFHYFKSKEKLYEELIRIGINGPMSMMPINAVKVDPIKYFEESSNQIFSYVKNDSFTAKMFVLMNQAYCSESVPKSVEDMLKEFDIYTPIVLLIEEGQKNGSIKQGDPYALSIAYWSSINGILNIMALNPDMPWPESNWVVDILRK